ncbi:hypothetical protein D3C77_361370 [compost metagenome]
MAFSPSATDVVPVMPTVVVLMVSLTWVTAGLSLMSSFSKLPPVAPVMVSLMSPASMYTSSLGASIVMLPLVLSAPMMMVLPLLKVTVTAVPAGLLRVAV